ncbi:MAG: hypothetical protein DLM63_08395 [Solirubrobacterales bacterium]|nr:MAG: hypothetical protein DLM63_08395 [Solirubrobacterales bacterium]
MVALAVILRVIWPADMEYKGDEAFLYLHATGPHPFPWVGQSSGVGTSNPGMGIWVYSVMAQGLGLNTPVQLVRGVMALNVIALGALALFALNVVPRRQREAWLWATALIAVNPLAVLFSRKIWIQSALPPFLLAALFGWWRRGQRAGAFAWGVIGAWLGQIHMTGFFFAGGLAAWTALYDRRSTRWRWWLGGSLLGALTLVPWLVHVVTHEGGPMRSLANSVQPRILGLWVTYPLSLNLFDSFGSDSWRLLAWPTVGGTSLYLVAATFAVIVGAGIAIAVRAFAVTIWPRRTRSQRPLGGSGSDTAIVIKGALWGYGLLITVSGVAIYRHYMIVTFALPFVALAVAALLRPRGRRLLAVLVVAEAALSVQYLTYIHARGGAPGGDYGVAYDAHHSNHRPP